MPQSAVDTHNKYTHGLYSYEWEQGWKDVSSYVFNGSSEAGERNMEKAAKQSRAIKIMSHLGLYT